MRGVSRKYLSAYLDEFSWRRMQGDDVLNALLHAIAKQHPPGVDYTADDLVQQMGNMEIDKEELDFSDTAIDIPPLPDYYHVDGGDHSQSKVDVVVHDVVDDIDSNVDIVDQTNDDE